VSWLCATGKVAEALALTVVQDTSLFVEVVPLKRRAQPWRTAALISTLATAGLITIIATKTDLLDGVKAFVRGLSAPPDATAPEADPPADDVKVNDAKPVEPGARPYRSTR
jgi:hypothetical protein